MQNLSKTLLQASREEFDLRGLALEGQEADGLTIGSIDLRESTLTRCSLVDCRFLGTGFDAVTLTDCDLSGAAFRDCGIKNMTFRDCRLLGTVFSGCVLNGARLSGCMGRYGSLTECTLKGCRLERCNFSGGAVARCKFPKTTVDRCSFSGCDFSGSALFGLDLSGCDIAGAIWSLEGLKNVTVNTAQALELSGLLGLHIVP